MNNQEAGIGKKMYEWANDLFPINRSITGPGVRETLAYLKKILPALKVCEVPSGTKAFDWIVPDEWTIRDAFITNEEGEKIVDYKNHNLHVLGYSEPVNTWLDCDELDKYIYSLPDQPEAIPYITSYYKRRWGFCVTHLQREQLTKGRYNVVIDSDIEPGVLNYGELILPGKEEKEILLSTYICHPSMGNNEVSGICVTTALAKWLSTFKDRRYTYRILFIPETIGSIVYLSLHAEEMKEKTVAGFNVTCVGDDRTYSFLPSRKGKTIADNVAKHVLEKTVGDYKAYSFLNRGSDERQFCHPLIDLPVVSIMRSKYDCYPEYHTSLDNLSFISAKGMEGSYGVLQKCLVALESNYRYHAVVPCEPQLGKRGLYPTISTKESRKQVKTMMNLLGYADGKTDLLEIAQIIGADIFECIEIAKMLEQHDILKQELF